MRSQGNNKVKKGSQPKDVLSRWTPRCGDSSVVPVDGSGEPLSIGSLRFCLPGWRK